MRDEINLSLMREAHTPRVTADEIYLSEFNTEPFEPRHISIKQRARFNPAELKEMEAYFKEKNQATEITTPDEKDYSTITDVRGVSEYMGARNLCIINPEYLAYCVMNSTSLLLDVYNRDLMGDGTPDAIKDKVPDVSVAINKLQLPTPEYAQYTMFEETEYHQNVSITKYPKPFPALSVNAPYEFFKDTEYPENILYWDNEKKEMRFAEKSLDEFCAMVEDIASNGIGSNLTAQIHGGRIISADDETYLTILIATYLKLPTIPITLYMLQNDGKKLLISNRVSDISCRCCELLPISADAYAVLKTFLDPYFKFFIRGISSDEDVQAVTEGDTTLHPKYLPTCNVCSANLDEHTYADYYLNENAGDAEETPANIITDDDVERMHHEMQESETAKMNAEVEKFISDMEHQTTT